MDNNFLKQVLHNHQSCDKCPSADQIRIFFEDYLGLLFPNFNRGEPVADIASLQHRFQHLTQGLELLLIENPVSQRTKIASEFFAQAPSIFDKLNLDAQALYQGDPAAKSVKEVIRSYPGFYAIAAYRVAHVLLHLGVLGLPRSITEVAHSKTGIDIHPGAQIGNSFCIDHGTGVVIGETAVIGDRVKIYQGVTIGALSVNKEDENSKRHPTIADDVIIYAGATILGGETVIGKSSIIGGNVWLTKSIPPGSKIYYKVNLQKDNQDPELIIIK
ncbi:MAG: serine acetyltransferase [Fulvivirga sp.]